MQPLNKPRHELFAQALIKHGGHQTNAYLEIYPKAKYASARHSASLLLTNAYIKQRIMEILEQKGLGFKEVIEKLHDFANAKYWRTDENGNKVLHDNLTLQIKALELTLRLYQALLKSGSIIYLTPEQAVQVDQIINKSEVLKQTKQGGV